MCYAQNNCASRIRKCLLCTVLYRFLDWFPNTVSWWYKNYCCFSAAISYLRKGTQHSPGSMMSFQVFVFFEYFTGSLNQYSFLTVVQIRPADSPYIIVNLKIQWGENAILHKKGEHPVMWKFMVCLDEKVQGLSCHNVLSNEVYGLVCHSNAKSFLCNVSSSPPSLKYSTVEPPNKGHLRTSHFVPCPFLGG